MKIVNYYSTVGLSARVPGFKQSKLVRFACNKLENETWQIYVESGHTLGQLRGLGTKTMSHEQMQEFFDDDNIKEFRNFATLFEIEV